MMRWSRIAGELVLAWMVLPASSSLAASITLNDMLACVFYDPHLAGYRENVEYQKSASGNTPLIHSLQYRHRLDNDYETSAFSLRAYINGYGEDAAAKNLRKTEQQISRAAYEILLSQKIRERYMLMVKLNHYRTLLSLYRKRMALLRDKIRVLNKQVQIGLSRINQAIAAEIDLERCRLDFAGLEKNARHTDEEIRHTLGIDKRQAIDDGGLITPAGIGKIHTALARTLGVDEKNLYYQSRVNFVQLARDRYEFEVARDRRYLDYIELTRDRKLRQTKQGVFTEWRTEFEIAFKFPFVTSDQVDINAKMGAYLQKKSEMARYLEKLRMTVAQRSADLAGLIAQFVHLEQSPSLAKANRSITVYATTRGADPLVRLDLLDHVTRHAIMRESVRYDIYLTYLDVLDLSGTLIGRPFVNYLSVNHERF